MVERGGKMRRENPLEAHLPDDWLAVERGMAVVKLDARICVLVPLLALTSLSKATRGLSLYPGRGGLALGGAVAAASGAIAYILLPTGIVGPFLTLWLLGSVGVATIASSLRPTAFVKPICVRCRLLPIIKEHEAIHLSGVASEKAVWDSMKTRHSAQSLSLDRDPAICSFCPIPKRLSEH